jgi:cold shock CspA family protein
MTESGYVYALINVSMQGLVKIGRTQRDPDERARELSTATGVPTPFVLVFDAYFQDCARAEAYVHTVLESKNYRVTSNREFFVAPVKEVILAIQAAEKLLSSGGIPEEVSAPSETASSSDEGAWKPILELADAAHYGNAETLQDDEEALRLYKQAARLGSAEACVGAAYILMHNDELQDTKEALSYLKDGAKWGRGDCHAKMAAIFAADRHIANWKTCWANYFASNTFRRNDDPGFGRGFHVVMYLQQARELRLPLDHRALIAEIKEDVFSVLGRMEALKEQEGGSGYLQKMDRHYARQAFGEKEETESLHGKVRWFNETDGWGWITLDTGEEARFVRADIMTLEAFTQGRAASLAVGLSVHCRVVQGPSRLIAFDVRVDSDPRPDIVESV